MKILETIANSLPYFKCLSLEEEKEEKLVVSKLLTTRKKKTVDRRQKTVNSFKGLMKFTIL